MPRGSKKQGKGPPDQSKGACCQYFDPATRTLCLQGFETRRAFREHALRAHGGGTEWNSDYVIPLPPDVLEHRLGNLKKSRRSGPQRRRQRKREEREREREEQAALVAARVREEWEEEQKQRDKRRQKRRQEALEAELEAARLERKAKHEERRAVQQRKEERRGDLARALRQERRERAAEDKSRRAGRAAKVALAEAMGRPPSPFEVGPEEPPVPPAGWGKTTPWSAARGAVARKKRQIPERLAPRQRASVMEAAYYAPPNPADYYGIGPYEEAKAAYHKDMERLLGKCERTVSCETVPGSTVHTGTVPRHTVAKKTTKGREVEIHWDSGEESDTTVIVPAAEGRAPLTSPSEENILFSILSPSVQQEPLYQEFFSEAAVGGAERGSPPATSCSRSTYSEVAVGGAERGSPPATSRLVYKDPAV